MTGEYREMTIKEAIAKIDSRKLLLPGIQRKYVWSSDQIEALFDSLMRDYPINTFMIWKVSDREVIDNHRFYTFLSKYRERYHEENDSVTLKGEGEFDAVIDGQQRLTSIYIGLKGSYAYKMPRKWWADTEDALPTRKLYLDLSGEVVGDDEGQMRYRFSFLSASDYAKFSVEERKTWYEVGDILKIRSEEDELDPYLDATFATNSFAKKTLRKLWKLVNVTVTLSMACTRTPLSLSTSLPVCSLVVGISTVVTPFAVTVNGRLQPVRGMLTVPVVPFWDAICTRSSWAP